LRGQFAEAVDAIAQRATVAVEIEPDRTVAFGRDVPDDDAGAVAGIEQNLLGFGQTGVGRRGAEGFREVHQAALRHIHQRHQAEVAGGEENQEPLPSGHVTSRS
jgi:hypothetical protein